MASTSGLRSPMPAWHTKRTCCTLTAPPLLPLPPCPPAAGCSASAWTAGAAWSSSWRPATPGWSCARRWPSCGAGLRRRGGRSRHGTPAPPRLPPVHPKAAAWPIVQQGCTQGTQGRALVGLRGNTLRGLLHETMQGSGTSSGEEHLLNCTQGKQEGSARGELLSLLVFIKHCAGNCAGGRKLGGSRAAGSGRVELGWGVAICAKKPMGERSVVSCGGCWENRRDCGSAVN